MSKEQSHATPQRDAADRFFSALHESVGICGHCGKKRCAGKQSHSTLPKTIPLTAVMEAAKKAGLEL